MNELILISVNIIIFVMTRKNEYIVDDIRHINRIRNTKFELSNLIEVLRNRLYGCGTFHINNLSDKTNLTIDHLFRTSINTLISILIYKAFGSNNISFWASLLYSFNPANNQTMFWLNARRYSINIILVLCAYMLGAWGILLYPIMPFFQINAIFTPLIILNPYISIITIPLFLYIGNKYILKWYKMRADAIPEGEYKTYKLRRIIVVIKTFGIYMSRMIIYNKPLFYSNKLYFWGINKNGNEDAYKINNDFFLGIILIICSICCFNYIPYEYRNVYIFMLLATIQWCNIITVTQTIADRYMSLPNVFMMLFISYAIHKHFPNNAESILFSLLVFYAIRLYDCMKMYRNITSFYDYHIYNNNKDVSCRIFKATDCMLNNDFMRAFTILREGLHYVPNDFKLLFQSACCCFRLGDKSNAKELLNKAENNYYIGQEDSLKEKVDKIKPYL